MTTKPKCSPEVTPEGAEGRDDVDCEDERWDSTPESALKFVQQHAKDMDGDDEIDCCSKTHAHGQAYGASKMYGLMKEQVATLTRALEERDRRLTEYRECARVVVAASDAYLPFSDDKDKMAELIGAVDQLDRLDTPERETERTCGTCGTVNCPNRGTDEHACMDALSFTPREGEE